MTGIVVVALARAAEPDVIVDLAGVLLDDRRDLDERLVAASSLAATADPEVLPFLRAAARDRSPEVQRAALDAAARFDDPEAVAIASWLVLDAASHLDVRLAAVEALGAFGRDDAALALWEIAGAKGVNDHVRSSASLRFEQSYPDAVARLGAPRNVSDPVGAAAGVLATGLAGSVLLEAVGEWGRSDAAAVIGGIGGGAVGVSGAAIYATSRPVTRGQGLGYASGTGWGLTYGLVGSDATLGQRRFLADDKARERYDVYAPALRALGTGAGTAVGAVMLTRDPDPADVVEVDVAAYLGSALALSAVDLAAWHPPPEPRDPWYYYYCYDYAPDGSCTPPDPELAEDWRTWNLHTRRLRSGVMLGGASAGIASGLLLNRAWELDGEDVAFAGLVGAEATVVGFTWPMALGVEDANLKGTVRAPVHAAIVGALALSEVYPVPIGASATGLYGAAVGNALGAGIPLLANVRDDGAVARGLIPLGVAGTAAGVLAAPWLAPGAGEWTSIGVGVPIASAEGLAVGLWLQEHDVIEGQQVAGLSLTTGALAGAGLITIGHYVDPKPEDVLFVGSAAVWGGWYGALVPMALELDVQPEDEALTGAITGDVFMAGSGLMLAQGFEPKLAIAPEMGGLVGATLGGLTAAMASRDPHDVALGALVGSTVGFGGGAAVGALVDAPPALRFGRTPHLPVRWSGSVLPFSGDEEKLGVMVNVRASGW